MDRGASTCRWAGCGHVAVSLEALVVHLDDAHVGHATIMGASDGRIERQLKCLWEGCWRDAPYAERTKLVQHLRAHTKEKPFQCPMPNCGMRFSVRSNLIAHGKRLHGRVLAPIVWSARHSNPPAPTTPLTPPPDAPKSGDVESSSDSKPAISAPVTTKTVPVLPPTLSTRDVLPPFLANLVHPTSPHPIPSTMMGDYPVSPPSTAASETDDSCSDDSVQKVDGNPVAVEDAVVEAVEPPRVEVRRISRREMALRKRNRLEHQVAAMTEGGNRLRDFSDNLVDMLHDAEQLDSGRGTNVTLSTAMRRLRKDMSALQQTLKLETANALLQLSVLPQHRLYPRLHFSPSFYNAHVM